ncbi:hypothetical protein CJF30_00010976 [Rutstroemia sp. NJR-2017a BBW]|nr:hypothetical protein CJF30_00010976 [Rutstroemia sp. NJR-2017a BBW]
MIYDGTESERLHFKQLEPNTTAASWIHRKSQSVPRNMPRVNRSSLQSPLDKPYAPTAIDIEIGLQKGTTAVLEATPECLQAMKQKIALCASQRIEELTKENGQLRLEIRYYQRMKDAMQAFFDDAKFITEQLKNTIRGFTEVQREAENDWCDARES